MSAEVRILLGSFVLMSFLMIGSASAIGNQPGLHPPVEDSDEPTPTATADSTAVVSTELTMSDQNQVVVVDAVTLNRRGYVAIHRGGVDGPIVGTSENLTAGNHEDVRIPLETSISNETEVVAIAYRSPTDSERGERPTTRTETPLPSPSPTEGSDSASSDDVLPIVGGVLLLTFVITLGGLWWRRN